MYDSLPQAVATTLARPRLTSLGHGGDCGCKIAKDVLCEILGGGERVCRRAGIPIAGGHSIDSVEPIYGLVVIGVVDPRRVKRKLGARDGDVLVLASRSASASTAPRRRRRRSPRRTIAR